MAATNPIAMSPHDHATQALTFLSQSKKEFAANDIFQGSEKLWGAACHALFAAVGQSGGRIPESHAAIRKRVEQLAWDLNEPELSSGFAIAESFHKIFYHGMMEEHELEFDFPKVERLVNRLLAPERAAGQRLYNRTLSEFGSRPASLLLTVAYQTLDPFKLSNLSTSRWTTGRSRSTA